MTSWDRIIAGCVLGILLLWSSTARAAQDVLILPTQVAAPEPGAQNSLREQARLLDEVLLEAAPDLGLVPQLSVGASRKPPADDELPALAEHAWVIAPNLSLDSRGIRLRLVAVAPESDVLLVRIVTLDEAQLELKAVVMLQDLIGAGRTGPAAAATSPPPGVAATSGAAALPPASTGRAVLALNTAVYGGYIGFTAHRSSGSTDSRLLYPLTALGAGLGLGAAMLVADEWNVTQGSAWYLSAGLVWPTAAGLALGEAYDGRTEYRHLYGLAGATAGLTLATSVVSQWPTTAGDAALAHSGGALGTLLGSLTEGLIEAELEQAPLRGIGYGSVIGVLLAGALGPSLELSASRVLFVDLSIGLGALTGAAVSTPVLLVGSGDSDNRSRIWFGGVIAGTLAGAALGIWFTDSEAAGAPEETVAHFAAHPYAGVLGYSETDGVEREPIYGAGLSGTW